MKAVTLPALGEQNTGTGGNSGTEGQNEKTPHKENAQVSKTVQTGDSAHPILWVGLAVLAVGAVVCVLLVRRHRK